jgi:hypothetical protein
MKLADIHATGAFISQSAIASCLPEGSAWLKRDYLFRPWAIEHRRIMKSLRHGHGGLVVSNSDYPIGKTQKSLLWALPHIHRLAVTNLLVDESSQLMTFPIGITDFISGSHLHELFSSTEQLTEAFSFSENQARRISVSFSPNTHRTRRVALRHALKSRYCEVIEPEFSVSGRQRALNHSATSLGVACPRGNGMDTHRLWETFYVGSIPIVAEGDYPRALLDGSGLPYLVIEDWSHLSRASTIDKLEEISGTPEKVLERLDINFWRQRLERFLR